MRKLLLAVLIMAPICLNAQLSGQQPEKAASKTTFVNEGGHWFFTLSGGAATLFSETTGQVDFFDNVKPTVGFAVGKWMSPVWGIRLSATGAKLKGFTYGSGSMWYKGTNYDNPAGYTASDSYVPYDYNPTYIQNTFLGDKKNDKDGKQGWEYDVNYAAGGLDLLLNVNNLFGTYNPTQVFNFIVFGGLGYAHTFKNSDANRTAVNSIAGKGGLILDFRLSDAVNLGLEANGLIMPEAFDRQVGGANNHDIVANVMLDLTYKFKPRNFQKAVFRDPREIDALNSQINALVAENNELRKRPVSCPACPECPKPVTIVKEEKKPIDYLAKPVFFRLGSAVVDNAQLPSIQEAVRYLKETPNARLKLTGYADKATGTPAGNKKLSEKRAQAVYDLMVKKYGISADRIETYFMGDDVQPFAENDWNRVVVFVKE